MPPEPKIARWKLVTGYVAFGVVAFVIGLYLTFPYDVLKERIVSEADHAGVYVKMGSLGPGLFGITASKVEVSRKMEPNEDKPPPALKIDSVSIRPSLYPFGIATSAKVLHGSIGAAVSMFGNKLRLSLDDLNLQDDNLKAFSGLSLSGHANGSIALDMPMTAGSRSQPSEPDLSLASGSISLDLSGLQVNGGSVGMYDLPKIVFGDVDAKLKFEKGMGTIDAFHSKSDELDLSIAGTVKLARRLDFCEPNVTVKFRAQPDLTKRLGMIASGFAMLPSDPHDPDFRTIRVQGAMGRINSPDLRF